MPKHKIFAMEFAKVYPLWVQKAERKGRTKKEIDEIICWLTGYVQADLRYLIDRKINLETFFLEAPDLNPNRSLIKGVICGVRVEEIKDSLMRELRYLDKLIDELARGTKMEIILRK